MVLSTKLLFNPIQNGGKIDFCAREVASVNRPGHVSIKYFLNMGQKIPKLNFVIDAFSKKIPEF